MKLQNFGLILALIAVLIFAGCEKKLTISDFPNYLLNAELTPGEKDKEVSVFLYTTIEKVDYKIQAKGKNGLAAIILNNTLKSKKLNEMSVDGIDDLIEKAYAVQVSQEKNKVVTLTTKIIFRLKDPKTTFKIIIQPRPVSIDKLKKAADSAAADYPPGALVASSSVTVKDKSDPAGLIKILVFWAILVAIVVVCIWSERKRRIDARAEKHYYDDTEGESSDEETKEEDLNTDSNKEDNDKEEKE